MACYQPLCGYRTPGGSVTFDRSAGYSDVRVTVSCGQCCGCRLERSRQWAVRCMHEAQMHEENCFITLTYDDEHMPPAGSLDLVDWQNFAKRLRRKLGPFRFYHCGEYGDLTGRPHYHAAVFGQDFSGDRRPFREIRGNQTWISKQLVELWGKGENCVIGELTFQSAAYVARYIMKKMTGERALEHYGTEAIDFATGEVIRLKPEYTTMSRRPGIGKAWYDKFKGDVYPDDFVITNKGQKARPPAYYDYQFELEDPAALAALKAKRVAKGRRHRNNNTPDRLAVREICQMAKTRTLRRDTI